MEIKINKEIRNYKENVFFGLTMRQFIFSLIACISAVVIYFIFKNKVNEELLSWLCILGAFPFAAMGFVNYNGMSAEKIFIAICKSKFVYPRFLTYKPKNYYLELLKNKEGGKNEDNKKHI